MVQYNLSYFRHISKDEPRIAEFEKFIENHLKELFSMAERAGAKISVRDTDLGSVINPGGSYRKVLTGVINSIHMQQYNPHTNEVMGFKTTHQENIFLTIFKEVETFQALMNRLKDYLDLLNEENHQWNIVWYTHYQHMSF